MTPASDHLPLRTRSIAAACLAAMLLGALLLAQGALAADEPVTGGLVEEVRYLPLADGRIAQVTALIDTTTADPDAAMQDLLPGGQEPATGGVSAQFVVWRKWAASDLPVTVYYDARGDTPELQQGRATMQWALAEWNSVAGSSFRFEDGGLVEAEPAGACGKQVTDGRNVVRFGEMRAGVLGSTCAVIDGSTVNGITRIFEFELELNPEINWSTLTPTPLDAYDLNSTMLHELGHALGLTHTDAFNATMKSTLAKGRQQRTITADDAAGVLALYGPGPTVTGTATQSPTTNATPSPTVTVTPTRPPAQDLRHTLRAPALARE